MDGTTMQQGEQFQVVTITPVRHHENKSFRYRLMVDGWPPDFWTKPGVYETPEEVIAKFIPPLRPEYQAGILHILGEGKTVTFSLKDAFAKDALARV